MAVEIFTKPPQDFFPIVEVASCFCESEQKILLLKRHPNKPQGGSWGIPAGKLEKDEKPIETVLREVYEEVGLEMNGDTLQEMGKLFIRHPHLDYIFHMFHKRFNNTPRLKLCLAEHIESKWVTVSEALQLPLIAGGKEALKYYEKWILHQKS